jgi:twitching motility protein PilT
MSQPFVQSPGPPSGPPHDPDGPERDAQHRSVAAPATGASSLADLMQWMVTSGASDLHLEAGLSPTLRINGVIQIDPTRPRLTSADIEGIIYPAMNTHQRHAFDDALELDFMYAIRDVGRFRVNCLMQRGSIGAVLRAIPWSPPAIEELGLPPIVATLAELPRGLVLVTGPTGSGKTTTLAALIDHANQLRSGHIVTIEDPIEYVHRHGHSVLIQREVGLDTHSFAEALKHVLRQDPDIIMIGEMRDLETISIALTAAETGHLVFASLHTPTARDTIDRVLDVFPPGSKDQVRSQLAASLQAVVSQALCQTPEGGVRVVATEVMLSTPAIKALIRDGKASQITSVLQSTTGTGMQTLNRSLAELVKDKKIPLQVAVEYAYDRHELASLLDLPNEAALLRASATPAYWWLQP